MHVEIWWSTKIWLLYKFVFHLCTNYPVLFFLWHHSNRSLRHQTFDQFYHVLFYIRFSSFSKRRKKVTILKRNLPIYETSAHSGLKKKRKSKLNSMYCVFFEYSSFAKHPHPLQFLLHLGHVLLINHAIIAFLNCIQSSKKRTLLMLQTEFWTSRSGLCKGAGEFEVTCVGAY